MEKTTTTTGIVCFYIYKLCQKSWGGLTPEQNGSTLTQSKISGGRVNYNLTYA